MNQTLNPDLYYNDMLFKNLKRESKKELRDKEIRIPSLANTYKNEPLVDYTFNKSNLINRQG